MLYRVTLEYEMVVEADDEYDAVREAKRATRDEEPAYEWGDPVESADDLPDGWTDDLLPWGGGGDETIGEILEGDDEQ